MITRRQGRPTVVNGPVRDEASRTQRVNFQPWRAGTCPCTARCYGNTRCFFSSPPLLLSFLFIPGQPCGAGFAASVLPFILGESITARKRNAGVQRGAPVIPPPQSTDRKADLKTTKTNRKKNTEFNQCSLVFA